MSDLFSPGNLQQDTGLLKERWQQEGSTQAQGYVSGSAGVRTVTSGSKYMVSNLMLRVAGAVANTTLTISDNATTIMVIGGFDVNPSQIIPFPTPLVFLTSVVSTIGGVSTGYQSACVGWEEKL